MEFVKKLEEKIRKKNGKEKVRVLAFGSSNTERFIPGMHWFDCFELAVKNKFGRIHHCINSGIGGETSSDLLNRFKTDAEFYRPDIVFITVGGNDSVPEKNLNADTYEKNLLKLYSKFKELDCLVIFQTYYAPIMEDLAEKQYRTFCDYMNIVRKVAMETGAGLIDHFKHWESLRQNMPEKHRELMNDAFHVNPLGNLVLGLFIARQFKLDLDESDEGFFGKAASYLRLMDRYAH